MPYLMRDLWRMTAGAFAAVRAAAIFLFAGRILISIFFPERRNILMMQEAIYI